MKLTIETTKRLAMHGLILLGLVVAATLIANISLFDETLHPDLERMGELANPVELVDNAMVGLRGLPAASDRDAFEVGREMVALFWAKHQRGEAVNLNQAEHQRLFGEATPDREWQAEYSAASCNARRELGCFGQLIAQLQETPLNGERLSLMLTRYEQIRRQNQFQEVQGLDFSSQMPSYGLYMQLSKLKLADTYLKSGTTDFLLELQKETDFWKLLLSEGDNLIAKMVAVAGLWTNLQYLAELLSMETLNPTQMQMVNAILQAPKRDELDIGEAFAGEMRYLVFPGMQFPGLEQKPLLIRWLTSATLQENATVNAYYTSFTQPLMALSKKSAPEFHRETQSKSDIETDDGIFPPSLYNLGGKSWLKSVTYPDVANYIGRTHDLSGMYSLLRLKLELMEAGDSSAQTVINQSKHRNPYTAAAMDYDAENSLLSFTCFSISICQVAL
ncbi:MAG: hypothetical protein WDZ30_07720 [Cellvibrionaceae bacterium]